MDNRFGLCRKIIRQLQDNKLEKMNGGIIMFKPWLINEKYRGTDHETIVKLHFMNPVEQDRIAGDSILLTTKAFPYFFKLVMNDIAALPADAPYRQVNMLIKRDVENAILKTINNSPELKKAWKLPTQDSLFSFGYRMRRLYITGKKSIDELKFDTVVPPATRVCICVK